MFLQGALIRQNSTSAMMKYPMEVKTLLNLIISSTKYDCGQANQFLRCLTHT